MWHPDLRLSGSWSLSGLIVLLHGLVVLSLLQLPALWLLLVPLVLLSMLMAVAKHGLLLLDRSVQRVWFNSQGWYLGLNNGVQLGPYGLGDATRLDGRFIRLSLYQSTWKRRHLIINREMIGEDQFRRLKVFLNWADNKGQLSGKGSSLDSWPVQIKQWIKNLISAAINRAQR